MSDPALVALGERLQPGPDYTLRHRLSIVADWVACSAKNPDGARDIREAIEVLGLCADALTRPVAAPSEGTLTREQAETRLDENELACICRVAMEHGIPAAHCAMFDALFPHDGSRT